jgi:CheY-like chemotaxis protein
MDQGLTEVCPTDLPRLRTVLLGDDDEGIRCLLTELLRAEGFLVIAAENRGRAAEMYRAHPQKFALVLLDMSSPAPTAEDALRAVRQTNPSARVMLLTGHSHEETVEQTMRKGFDGLIAKPFTISELVEPLRRFTDAAAAAAA